jgi:hypothetical protein
MIPSGRGKLYVVRNEEVERNGKENGLDRARSGAGDVVIVTASVHDCE